MILKLHRWSRKVLLPLAALPVFQAAGACDPASVANTFASSALSIASQTNTAVLQLFIGAIQQTLLQAFPSADILQILLGANRSPFFP